MLRRRGTTAPNSSQSRPPKVSRLPGPDGPTIGILLAATRDDVVECALRGLDTPLAVSTYTTTASLPDDVRRALPSVEDFTDVVRHARDEPPTVD